MEEMVSNLLDDATALTVATPPAETVEAARALVPGSLTTVAGTASQTPGLPVLAGREPSPPDRRGRVETLPSELSARYNKRVYSQSLRVWDWIFELDDLPVGCRCHQVDLRLSPEA